MTAFVPRVASPVFPDVLRHPLGGAPGDRPRPLSYAAVGLVMAGFVFFHPM